MDGRFTPYSLAMTETSCMSFIAWTSRNGRSQEIAAALGARAVSVCPTFLEGKRLVLFRYSYCAIATVAHLAIKRPKVIVMTIPPTVAGLLIALHTIPTRTHLILDSHPTAFGAKENKLSQILLPLHKWLAKKALCTFVTTDHWVKVVEQWGGKAIVVHEAPSTERVIGPKESTNDIFKVLFVGNFASDEPIDQLITAARLLPEVDFSIAGDIKRMPQHLADQKPSNVSFIGYLRGSDYQRALAESDVVIALTTESTSVMRAAYEAIYALRPLISSDTEAMKELFPEAIFVENKSEHIAAGIRKAREKHQRLLMQTKAAFDLQTERWNEQLSRIEQVLGSISK